MKIKIIIVYIFNKMTNIEDNVNLALELIWKYEDLNDKNLTQNTVSVNNSKASK